MVTDLTITCDGTQPDDTRAHDQVVYCAAWDQHLCAECRRKRNDKELQAPARIKALTIAAAAQIEMIRL